MTAYVPFGPGVLLLGDPGTDFACEVSGGRVTHTYEEIGTARTMMCGTVRPAARQRTDGLAFDVENDLGGSGLYQYLLDNDMQEVPFQYTPNNDAGAKWAGTIVVTLPGEIGATEYGSPLVSSVEWVGVGAFTFTPATAP